MSAGACSALAASNLNDHPVIIEYCCASESKLCQVTNKCNVVRISKESHDQTTAEGRQAATEVAHTHSGALLWTSLSCTARCPQWAINEQRPGGRGKRRARLREFLSILRSWVEVVRIVKERGEQRGGHIAWELPRGNWFRKHPKIVTIMAEFAMDAAIFDGCAFGLLSSSGRNYWETY